jgi:hypothetical protein
MAAFGTLPNRRASLGTSRRTARRIRPVALCGNGEYAAASKEGERRHGGPCHHATASNISRDDLRLHARFVRGAACAGRHARFTSRHGAASGGRRTPRAPEPDQSGEATPRTSTSEARQSGVACRRATQREDGAARPRVLDSRRLPIHAMGRERVVRTEYRAGPREGHGTPELSGERPRRRLPTSGHRGREIGSAPTRVPPGHRLGHRGLLQGPLAVPIRFEGRASPDRRTRFP